MKKLLLLLLLSLGFIGSANADTLYTCESIENSVYFEPAKQSYINFDVGLWKTIFTLSNNKYLITVTESSTGGYAGSYFLVNDYINDNNFNATSKNDTYDISPTLSYENGYLIFSWMPRGKAAVGVIVSKCSTPTFFYNYEMNQESWRDKIPVTRYD